MKETLTFPLDVVARAVARELINDQNVAARLRQQVCGDLQLVGWKEAARLLSISKASFFRTWAPRLPTVRLDGQVRYRLGDIEKLVALRTHTAAS